MRRAAPAPACGGGPGPPVWGNRLPRGGQRAERPRSGPGGGPPPDGPVEATFSAAADAYVDSSHSSRNYGRENELRVDTEPVLRSYLRFALSGPSGTAVTATLQVLAKDSRGEGFRGA